jgi:putative DNA-invertase from lambdoid prophage Rac
LSWPSSTRGAVAVLRGVKLHLLDLGGDIAGNGLSKLFLTIAAAFAEAERDRIRERIGQVKADQKARGRYLGGSIPWLPAERRRRAGAA